MIKAVSNENDIDTLLMDHQDGKSNFGNIKLPTNIKTYDYYDEIRSMVKLLSVNRALNNKQWLELGQCLYNISGRMLNSWIEFSRKNPLYVEGSCESIWDKFNAHIKPEGQSNRVGAASLHHWAKCDNYNGYLVIYSKELDCKIIKSRDQTTQSVAAVVYQLYKHQYKCAVVKGNIWYYFNGHRWYLEDNAMKLRHCLGNDVVATYLKLIINYNSSAYEANDDSKDKYLDISKKLTKVTNLLRDHKYKEKIVKECQTLFFDNNFILDLDSDRFMLGFENGVYDLQVHEFRNGRPEDNLSLTTGLKYIPYNPDNSIVQDIDNFMALLFPNVQTKQYMYIMIASLLEGQNPFEKFHIWVGNESSSMSILLELINLTFGDYVKECPSNVFAHGSNVYHSALLKDTRAIFMKGNTNDRLNMGLVKEWTGGDRIHCNMVGRDPIDYKPQSKLIYCCSKPPALFREDVGLQRRVSVVEFSLQSIDITVNDKLNKWKETFMSILLHYYIEYKKFGLIEPPQIKKSTQNFFIH